MSNYKPTFGVKRRNKRKPTTKGEKGEPGIGFKLTPDGNYDIYNKRLTNIGDPGDYKDAINIEYFDKRIVKLSTSLE
jgi:hypothetical protein